MVTLRCMRILVDEPEIVLALENSKNNKMCACVCVCVLAQFWGHIFLLIFGKPVDWCNWFYPIAHQLALICLGYIVEDGVTALCSSTALCQAEHPVRFHLNQPCKTCVRFLSVTMKGDLKDNDFRKACILTDLRNWCGEICICVSFPNSDI